MAETANLANVLLVQDDPVLGHMMVEYLQHNQMSAVLATTLSVSVETYARLDPDLIILHLKERQDDHIDVLKDIRLGTDVPVIIVNGHSFDEIDRVIGLELGSGDCLAKPFGMRELLALIRAILRRRVESTRKGAQYQRTQESGIWRFAGWELRVKSRELRNPWGTLVPLTKGEYALLLAFLDAAEKPLSREYLLQATRVHEDIFDRSIDVQILRLRRKLEEGSSLQRMIQTQRGVGYVFAVPVERA